MVYDTQQFNIYIAFSLNMICFLMCFDKCVCVKMLCWLQIASSSPICTDCLEFIKCFAMCILINIF